MTTCYRLILSVFAGTGTLAITSAQSPTPSPEGRVTSVFHDVQLLPENAPARPAIVDDRVDENMGLRTGDRSRSELTFADLTITRLGANTIFSFNKAGRSVHLDSGTILLYARKNSGAVEVVTKAVSVAITGTTVIVESRPRSFDRLIVLEGDGRASLNDYPDESTPVRAGQVLNVNAGARKIPRPGRIDISRILKTHPLIQNFPPLPSLDLILAAMQNQNPNLPPPRLIGSSGPQPVPSPNYVPNPPGPPSGPATLSWCCIDGQVIRSTEAECRARGGQAFRSEQEARAHCGRPCWVCIDGKVVEVPETQARLRGKQCYRSREEAVAACEAGGKCWCCVDTANGMSVVQMARADCENGGGQCYGSRKQALRNCRGKGPTPSPTVKATPKAAPTPKATPWPTPKPTSTLHHPGFPPKSTPTPKKKYPPIKTRPKATPTPTPGQVIH